jgi:hypothetical protein
MPKTKKLQSNLTDLVKNKLNQTKKNKKTKPNLNQAHSKKKPKKQYSFLFLI